MAKLQQTAVPVSLERGTHLIKLMGGGFSYRPGHPTAHSTQGEPIVMLWIYGGKVVNQKTGVPVVATWSSLNGLDDVLTLEVLEPATLCAFFFDTYSADNQGAIELSIVRI